MDLYIQSSPFVRVNDCRELEMIFLFLFIYFQEYASTVRQIAQSSSMNMKDRLTIELHCKPVDYQSICL